MLYIYNIDSEHVYGLYTLHSANYRNRPISHPCVSAASSLPRFILVNSPAALTEAAVRALLEAGLLPAVCAAGLGGPDRVRVRFP